MSYRSYSELINVINCTARFFSIVDIESTMPTRQQMCSKNAARAQKMLTACRISKTDANFATEMKKIDEI